MIRSGFIGTCDLEVSLAALAVLIEPAAVTFSFPFNFPFSIGVTCFVRARAMPLSPQPRSAGVNCDDTERDMKVTSVP